MTGDSGGLGQSGEERVADAAVARMFLDGDGQLGYGRASLAELDKAVDGVAALASATRMA